MIKTTLRKLTLALLLLGLPLIGSAVPIEDITPPSVQSIEVSPSPIDVSQAAQTITVDAQATDDLSGISYLAVYFASPSGRESVYVYVSPLSADPGETHYRGSASLPQFSEAGNRAGSPGFWEGRGRQTPSPLREQN